MRITFILTASLMGIAASAFAASAVTEITLPGKSVFPESITSTSDGTLIVGSSGNGNVLRIAKGSSDAVEWIKAGTAGLGQVLGVYADPKNKLLWVCSNGMVGSTAVKTFDLKSGAPKGSFALKADTPTGNPLCNDIAVAGDGTAYIADTRQAIVWMLKPGATELVVAAKDPLLAGADGLAFSEKSVLIVNSVTTGKLLRVPLGADGKGTAVTELKLSRPLERPDGMRALGKNRLLLAENSGKMSIVTLSGDSANVNIIKEKLESTPGVTATRGMAWVVEGKLNYRNDPKLKDKDPAPFKMYAVPLPKN